MAEALLLCMLVSAVLYAVLGGADFGVGIIEPLLGKEREREVDEALLPVWEANHVWLVLLVVIAFVGFPALFVAVATFLHIPLLLVLLGIVARGSAFTFRHYDPEAAQLRAWYSFAFRAGSLLTPLFLGVIAAACVQGRITRDLTRGTYALFVAPWNTPFCWASGLFVCALFSFQGAALLSAELRAKTGEPMPLLRLTRALHLLAIAMGALVWLIAWLSDLHWIVAFWRRPLSLACVVIGTCSIPLVAHAFQRGKTWWLRLAVGAQVAAVLIGLFGAQYPTLLRLNDAALTLESAAAPAATLRSLLITVAIGLALIVPALSYLLHVYKLAPESHD